MKHTTKNKARITLISSAFLALLQACAYDDPNRNAKQSAAIGAIAGAVIGHQIDQDKGRIVGAAIGGIAGASVGRYQDQQQRELEVTLAQEQQAKKLEIERLQDETLKISLSNDATFDFDRSDIKPAFYTALDRLANTLVDYDRTVLHIIGHTDSVGSSEYNQALSIRRAQSVAQYLLLKGVQSDRLEIAGRGETEPRGSNDTAAARRSNRRVEIYIIPVIEGNEDRSRIAPRPS